MPYAPSTRNIPVRSVRVGLKPHGLGSTIGCCAVSSDHNGTLLTWARKAKARALERSESPPTLSPARSERGRARTRRTGTARTGTATAVSGTAGTATAGTAVVSTAGAATAGTATAGTATVVTTTVAAVTTTAVESSHGTIATSASAGSADGRGVAAVRRSPRKRTPVPPSRDSSPKKKKTKSSSSSTTSSRKKGGDVKASSKDLAPQGPATRSGASKRKAVPSAAAATAPEAVTAPSAGTAPTASTSESQALKPKTPTKAALKSYDQSFALRDPLMPHLEDDPLERGPLRRLFRARFGG